MKKAGSSLLAGMAMMEQTSKASTSGHADTLYKPAPAPEAPSEKEPEAGEEPAPDKKPAARPQAPARQTPRKQSGNGPARAAQGSTSTERREPQSAAPVPPMAGDTETTVGEIGPTPMVPTSERQKYTIDIPPALRQALLELLIRDVEAGRKVAQWQHADAAITHFLPQPTDPVPDFGDEWIEFGIALRKENRRNAELLKLRLKAAGRTRPYRCYLAEAIRRYIEALAPDLVADIGQ